MNSKDLGFLIKITDILHYQDKPSIANQGQAMDGISALYNYNELAKQIDEYLSEKVKTKI